jgi:hypothetical protein
MNLTSYISDLKSYLATIPDALPVVEGPVEFALNTQSHKNFVSVHETTIGYEPLNSTRTYSSLIGIVIQIHTEKAPADIQQKHLTKARSYFDVIWRALSGFDIAGYQLIREQGERLTTDNATEVTYQITCNLDTTEYETCLS